ncbi:hypothetical protein, partial [Burkholderia cenocepacia]|uniref:hypothetical protein n=1 Tax=Burkholderia cenocepacia TaxID=95486 RepID=UPI001C0C7196
IAPIRNSLINRFLGARVKTKKRLTLQSIRMKDEIEELVNVVEIRKFLEQPHPQEFILDFSVIYKMRFFLSV